MRHTLFALAVSLAACGASQSGQRPGVQSATKSSDPSAKSDDQDKLCEETAVTGTNITRMVCRTRAEEQAELNAARDWRQQDPMNHR